MLQIKKPKEQRNRVMYMLIYNNIYIYIKLIKYSKTDKSIQVKGMKRVI